MSSRPASGTADPAAETFVPDHADAVVRRLHGLFSERWVSISGVQPFTSQPDWQGVPIMFMAMAPDHVQVSCIGGRRFDIRTNDATPVELAYDDDAGRVTVTQDGELVLALVRLREPVASDFHVPLRR